MENLRIRLEMRGLSAIMGMMGIKYGIEKGLVSDPKFLTIMSKISRIHLNVPAAETTDEYFKSKRNTFDRNVSTCLYARV